MTDQGPNDIRIFRNEHATLWVFIAMMAVSTAAILIRLSTSHPLTIALWRLVIAEAVILPFAYSSIKRDMGMLDRRTSIGLILVGGALASHFGLWIWSFQFTTVASSVLLVTTHPLFVAVISYFAFKERLDRTSVLGMIIAMAGSVIIIGGDLSVSGEAMKGNLLALGGGLMAGIYIMAGSMFRKRLSLPTYGSVVYGSAALFIFVAVIFAGVEIAPTEGKEYMIFTLMALGPMLAGHTIYNWSLKYISPTLISVSLLGEPVGASFLAFILLNEFPAPGALMGGPFILLGIFIVAGRNR